MIKLQTQNKENMTTTDTTPSSTSNNNNNITSQQPTEEDIKYLFRRHPQAKNKFQFYLQWLFLVISVIAILAFCSIVNVIQLIAFALGKIKGFKRLSLQGVTVGGGFAWAWFHILLEVISGLKIEYSGDDVPEYENAICIGNHVSDMDPFMMIGLAMRKGMMGNCKFLAKKAVKRIPFIGWGLDVMGTVFLERNWSEDQQSLIKSFAHLTTNRVPFWLISYLEGTRINDKNLVEARKFARDNNLHVPQMTMIPRVKGFAAMLKELQKNPDFKYVYDFTFGYCDGVFFNSDFMSRSLRGHKVCVNVKRIPISEIPLNDEKQLKQWLFDRFQRKDEILLKLAQKPKDDRHFDGEPILNAPFQILNWFTKPFEHMNADAETKKTK